MRTHKIHALWLVLLLAGCSGQKALIRHATDIPSSVRVILLEHNAVGEVAAAVKDDPAVSIATKAKFRDAYRKTVCSKEELSSGSTTGACKNGPAQRVEAAGRAYEAVRDAQTEAEAQNAIDDLTNAMIDLIDLTGAR